MGSPSDPLERHALSPRELKRVLEARASGSPFLALLGDGGGLTLVLLDHGRRLTIGRHEEADVAVSSDPEVSGLHAELEYLAGEWTIADDGLSRNGTYVNGARLTRRHRLRNADRIRVGRTVIAFEDGQEDEQRERTAAAISTVHVTLTDTQRRVLIALCRPYASGGTFANPASNRTIADEVFLGVDAVKLHLRTLFGKFGLADLAQNQKRAKLAEYALQTGVITEHDLAPPD